MERSIDRALKGRPVAFLIATVVIVCLVAGGQVRSGGALAAQHDHADHALHQSGGAPAAQHDQADLGKHSAYLPLAVAKVSAAAACPCSIWSESDRPELETDPDTSAVELGVKFRSAEDGQITGIRFYKGGSNTGAHVGNLWSSSGQLLARATFTNETASGWQQVNFAAPVTIKAGTTYVASYFAPNGRYSVNEGYFADNEAGSTILRALRDGASGPNGVYRYGASSTFPNQSYRSSNYWVDVVFEFGQGSNPTPVPSASPTPRPSTAPPTPQPSAPPTPQPSAPPASNGQATLLASYLVRPYPEYENSRYQPRAETASPYAGWDRLDLPGKAVNDGINTTLNNADWLTIELRRPAAVAIVWRGQLAAPDWLRSWPRATDYTGGGNRFTTYRKNLPAGKTVLGAVNNPGVGTTQATYVVLLAESDGTPSAAPDIPSGRETPRANQACPPWVHDQYTAAGPDGKNYPTWHPQIDPVYWCYFQHEHGSDPSLFLPDYKPLYGYSAAAMGGEEGHAGFKSYVFSDNAGHRLLMTHHFGTASLKRACVRHHTVDLAVADAGSGRLLADVHIMGDFGKSKVNSTEEMLTPPDCPNQAAQSDAAGSLGIRMLPAASRGAIGYEPWRVDDANNILGLRAAGLTFNTPSGAVICNSVVCDQAVTTGSTGEFRFFSFGNGFGVRAGANTGVFYTDAMGRQRLPNQAGAMRQYVEAGLNISLPRAGDNEECYPTEPWRSLYVCTTGDAPHGTKMNLEGALKLPN